MNGILTIETCHRNVAPTVIQADDPSVTKAEKIGFYMFPLMNQIMVFITFPLKGLVTYYSPYSSISVSL